MRNVVPGVYYSPHTGQSNKERGRVEATWPRTTEAGMSSTCSAAGAQNKADRERRWEFVAATQDSTRRWVVFCISRSATKGTNGWTGGLSVGILHGKILLQSSIYACLFCTWRQWQFCHLDMDIWLFSWKSSEERVIVHTTKCRAAYRNQYWKKRIGHRRNFGRSLQMSEQYQETASPCDLSV